MIFQQSEENRLHLTASIDTIRTKSSFLFWRLDMSLISQHIVTLKQKWPKSFFYENKFGIPLYLKFDFASADGG